VADYLWIGATFARRDDAPRRSVGRESVPGKEAEICLLLPVTICLQAMAQSAVGELQKTSVYSTPAWCALRRSGALPRLRCDIVRTASIDPASTKFGVARELGEVRPFSGPAWDLQSRRSHFLNNAHWWAFIMVGSSILRLHKLRYNHPCLHRGHDHT
jgi:hypothetical protein